MKIKLLLLFFGILMFNTSCNKDDDNQNYELENLILGDWYIVNKIVNGNVIPYDDHEKCGRDYLQFREDGSVWSVDVWDCEKEFQKLGNYSFENKELIIEGKKVEILKLDGKSFSTKLEYDYDHDGEIDEVIENFEK
ncbi:MULTISPECIES: hypothetical protein [Aquimarina]|uniref:hypothetical protein n=1 Tax=Aquimarina TaxID=290174 RepID=UPI000CDEE8C7|nr:MULTISPECIES: hypothetical protein [Aquimarina]